MTLKSGIAMSAFPFADPAARSRQNLIGLAVHASAFFVVGTILVLVNLATTPGLPWFSWSLAGWGIGLAMHTVAVFRFETLTDEQKRRYLERQAFRCVGCGCGRM